MDIVYDEVRVHSKKTFKKRCRHVQGRKSLIPSNFSVCQEINHVPKETVNQEIDINEQQIIEKSKKENFFSDKIFAITAKGDNDKDQEKDDSLTYARIIKLIKQNGGKVSNTIHRRVFALIATTRSVLKKTQRIRKAVKLQIPIVSTDFLLCCEHKKYYTDMLPFIIKVDLPIEKPQVLSPTNLQVIDNTVFAADSVRVINLGCCCCCHDQNELFCSWCKEHHSN